MSDLDNMQKQQYAEFYKKCKIRKRTIMYEAFSGRGMICNPHAIFKAFMQRKDFFRYHHYWVLSDFEDNKWLIDEYKKWENIFFVEYNSIEYLRLLCEVQYLVNNSPFPTFFAKKPEQIYINTWHGTPLKTLGFDMPDGNISAANTIRTFLQTDYLISPNRFQTNMYLKSYKLNGIYEGKILEIGQPRNDFILNTKKGDFLKKLEKLGCSIDPSKKIILYAPTWKGTSFANPELDLNGYFDFIRILESKIDMSQYQILIKVHQIVYKFIKNGEKITRQFLPATIDSNELMAVVDILISDYSSIYFDFLKTGKPILFYIPDIDEYKKYRGVYFPLEKLPGPSSKCLDEIVNWLENIDQVFMKFEKQYQENLEWACKYDDGKVSEKILDIVLDGKKYSGIKSNFVNKKKRILISRGGMSDNEITEALQNLLKFVDYNKYDITVYVSAPKNEANRENILAIEPKARVLTRVGTMIGTNEENSEIEQIQRYGIQKRLFSVGYPKEAFAREYSRCFGNAKFDIVIDFYGENFTFAMLLLEAGATRKFIWQRYEISNSEQNEVFKSIYYFYDYVVATNALLMEENKKCFKNKKIKKKLMCVHDIRSYEKILNKARTSEIVHINGQEFFVRNSEKRGNGAIKLSLVKVPNKDRIHFVTIGESENEKKYVELIRVFAKFANICSEADLHIIDSGNMDRNLRKVISDLQLEHRVFLIQSMENPYGYMGKCQCFVCISNDTLSTGKQIVAVRAMNMPLILLKSKTSGEALYLEHQLVVEDMKEDMIKGFEMFVNGRIKKYKFDIEKWKQNAYSEFEYLINRRS